MWEHRSSPRVPASGEVLLFLNGMPVLSGEVRNVCRDGLFVATRPPQGGLGACRLCRQAASRA